MIRPLLIIPVASMWCVVVVIMITSLSVISFVVLVGNQLEALVIIVGLKRCGGEELIEKIFVNLDVGVSGVFRSHDLGGLRLGIVLLLLLRGLRLFLFLRADGGGNFLGLCFHFLLREGTEVCLLTLRHHIASVRLVD